MDQAPHEHGIQSTHVNSNIFTKILGCSTVEQCRKIQKGNIILRRVGKWIALCSIGITCAVSYRIDYFHAKALKYIEDYDNLRNSRVVQWFYSAPPTDWIRELIKYYNTIDKIQNALLIFIVFLTIRWIYADSIVRGNRALGFWVELMLIALANYIIYIALKSERVYHSVLSLLSD